MPSQRSRPWAALSFLAHSLGRAVSGARPVFDPHAVPVHSVDAHLPAVPPGRLTPEALRRHWQQVPLVAPERPGDGGLFPGRTPRDAAVLVPLVMREAGVQVLLTRRTAELRDHAGQVSFPGGRLDPEDADAWSCARREAAEEIGLHDTHLEPLGLLPVYETVTAYRVTPCVALVRPGFSLSLQVGEVAEAFEVPLAYLMNPAHHRRHRVELPGLTREFLSMPWPDEGGHYIWGATASMLRNLYHQLRQGR